MSHETRAREPVRAHGDLAALVRAATHGDERAWGGIIAGFGPLVRSIARQHRLQAADVEDVAQRTWLQLVRYIPRLREPVVLAAWLATTARREALKTHSACPRELVAEDPAACEHAHGDDAQAALEAAERRAALMAALERIPPRQRVLLRLLAVEPSLSYGEIGALLGMPIGSIGPTRARAMVRLRQDKTLLALAE